VNFCRFKEVSIVKKLCIKFLIFCIPILLFLGCVELFYRCVPNNYSVKNDYITKNKNTIEVLIFGNSHAFYALNPAHFSLNTFNLSNISQTLYFDSLLLKHHLNDLPKLKCVVLCIEYNNLSQVDDSQDDIWRKYYYQNYMNLDVPIASDYDINNYLLFLNQTPQKTKELIKRYYTSGSILDCDSKGWGNNFVHRYKNQTKEEVKKRAMSHEDCSVDFSINKNRITSIIQELKKRDVKLLIVSLPQTPLYTSFLNQEKLKLVFQTCQNFQNEHPNQVYYLNLFTDKRFVKNDFADADHLNGKGSDKCSKLVNSYIEEMVNRIN
jgi:hypothetical protein